MLRRTSIKYCITLYFRGRKISRKVNLKYFREKIFSRIYCSREIIFPRKYLPAKISSRENILSRKYLPAKISSRENIFPRFCPLPQICRLVGLGYAVYRLLRNLLGNLYLCNSSRTSFACRLLDLPSLSVRFFISSIDCFVSEASFSMFAAR